MTQIETISKGPAGIIKQEQEGNPLVGHPHVIEEAVVRGGTMLEEAPVVPLTGLAKDVGAGVPKDGLALGVVHAEELKAAVGLKGAVEVPLLRVNLGHDHLLGKLLADPLGNFQGSDLP